MDIQKHLVFLAILLSVYATVRTQPNCKTYEDKDVVCTAGDSDYILQRGLVSDNNKTTGITLRNCRITKIDLEAFENDDNLKYIDLSVNKIDNLILGVLDGNHQVTHLNLSYNMLTSFPLGLFDQKTNLEVLDLKGNKLNALELGVFDPLTKLVHLDLSSNALVGKDMNIYIFDQSTKIRFMDFSRNDMSDSSENLLQAFTAMDFLNLDRCSLKEVPTFAIKPNLKSMKHLMLSTNQISKINASFVNLDDLEILNFADNIITEIAADAFSVLKKLRLVVLRNNRLKTLPEQLFFQMTTLGNIDLSYNSIEYIPVQAFRGTTKLKNLNLSHNRFSYLEANFYLELKNSGVRLKKFYFNDNPWQCACLNEVLKEMKTYNIGYNTAKYDGDNPVCVTTREFNCKRQSYDNELFIEMYDDELKLRGK